MKTSRVRDQKKRKICLEFGIEEGKNLEKFGDTKNETKDRQKYILEIKSCKMETSQV